MSEAPRWRRRKSARPEEIVQAALDVFTTRGFAASRLEEIAQKAGVTKGTLYLYFDSKEALLKAVIAANVVPNIDRLEAAIDAHPGPVVDLLRNTLTGMTTMLLSSNVGRLPKLMISEAANFPDLLRDFYDNVLSRIFGLHQKLLRRGIRQGEFRKVDVEVTARNIHAQILFLCLWQHSVAPVIGHPIDVEQHLTNAVDILINGLRKS